MSVSQKSSGSSHEFGALLDDHQHRNGGDHHDYGTMPTNSQIRALLAAAGMPPTMPRPAPLEEGGIGRRPLPANGWGAGY
jgi:hypothetical protein